MRCKDCGFANGEDDHRCLRCGRRLAGLVISAPAGYSGANALALDPRYDHARNETQDFTPAAGSSPVAVSPPLFAGRPDGKVIPFDEILQRRAGKNISLPAPTSAAAGFDLPAELPAVHPASPPPRPTAKKRGASPPVEQSSLDFARAGAPLTLRTETPTQIFCDQTVATPQHRLTASAIDGAMILLAFGCFTGVVTASGASFGADRLFWITLGMSLFLISLFYGLVFAIAGRETAGMSMTDLQLITFDGFPVDGRSRAVRVASTWLSFCSGGLGLVWAVADEENLTWHDHISKTFPTSMETPRHFVRQTRK